MKEKYAFCVGILILTITTNKYIRTSFSDFYRFEIEKTVKTTGVLTKAFLYEGVGTTEYQCDILYYHNGTPYNFSDDISYRSHMNYKKGDSINVIYNKRKPLFATINSSSPRYFSMLGSFILVLSSLYAIFILIKDVLSYIRKKDFTRI